MFINGQPSKVIHLEGNTYGHLDGKYYRLGSKNQEWTMMRIVKPIIKESF